MFERRSGRCELLALQNHPEHFFVCKDPNGSAAGQKENIDFQSHSSCIFSRDCIASSPTKQCFGTSTIHRQFLFAAQTNYPVFLVQDGGTPYDRYKWSFSTAITTAENKMGTWGYNPYSLYSPIDKVGRLSHDLPGF